MIMIRHIIYYTFLYIYIYIRLIDVHSNIDTVTHIYTTYHFDDDLAQRFYWCQIKMCIQNHILPTEVYVSKLYDKIIFFFLDICQSRSYSDDNDNNRMQYFYHMFRNDYLSVYIFEVRI